MHRQHELYTVKDLAAAVGEEPKTVRRHLRSLGVWCGSGRRHEWDAARYHRLLELVERRIAGGLPARRALSEVKEAGAGDYRRPREARSIRRGPEIQEIPDMPAGIEEMQISTFKATCLSVLERVGKTGQPVLVTRYGQPVAQIIPPPSGEWLGTMAGTGRVLGDIVAPVLDAEEWEALG